MKYSFAIAALFAMCALDGAAAINLSAEPTKEEKEASEARKDAALKANSDKKEALDEAALKAETKAMNDAESEKDRNARYLKEVYEKNR